MFAALTGFIWGLMEALWFFIIPDVGLSYVAMKGPRKAAMATFSVIIGAMLGACILYFGLHHIDSPENGILWLEGVWSHFPGYYPKMLDLAHQHLQSSRARGLILGPNSGIPYRFYILEAYKIKIPLLDLLLWTPIARLERIILAPAVVCFLKWGLNKINSRRQKFQMKTIDRVLFIAITLYWIGIYVWYWGSFLPKTYS